MHHLGFQMLRPQQQQLGFQQHSLVVDLSMKNVHLYVRIFIFFLLTECQGFLFGLPYFLFGLLWTFFWCDTYNEAEYREPFCTKSLQKNPRQKEYAGCLVMHHLGFQLLCPRQQRLGFQYHPWLVGLKMENVHSYLSKFVFF